MNQDKPKRFFSNTRVIEDLTTFRKTLDNPGMKEGLWFTNDNDITGHYLFISKPNYANYYKVNTGFDVFLMEIKELKDYIIRFFDLA